MKITIHFDHSAFKHLLEKKDSKPRLIRWMSVLQEFQLKIKDKPEAKNLVADHLGRLEMGEMGCPFSDRFLNETLYAVSSRLPCDAEIVNYIITITFPIDLSLIHISEPTRPY